jgi:hypothetical protein
MESVRGRLKIDDISTIIHMTRCLNLKLRCEFSIVEYVNAERIGRRWVKGPGTTPGLSRECNQCQEASKWCKSTRKVARMTASNRTSGQQRQVVEHVVEDDAEDEEDVAGGEDTVEDEQDSDNDSDDDDEDDDERDERIEVMQILTQSRE